METFELHSLYWPNASQELVDLHKRCFRHIGISVQYTEERIPHGEWIDRILRQRLPHLDAIGFVDIDCLAYSGDAVKAAYRYVRKTGSFLGLAQSANHLPTAMDIYAAPSFLVISRAAYETLKRPSLAENLEADVAQNLSRVANAAAFGYRALYPFGYHSVHPTGLWRLGNYGHYGLGTEYEGGFFHNFNSRSAAGLELFTQKANAILRNEAQPSTAPFMCKSYDLEGISVSKALPDTVGFRLYRARQKLSMSIPEPLRRLKRRLLGQSAF